MLEPQNDNEFGEYRDYLIVLARSQVSVDLRGRIDPSDLVQETIYDALRAPARERERAQTFGWLRKMLHDNLVDRLRRLRLENRVASLDALLDQTSTGISRFVRASQSAPEARVAREEDEQILADVLRQLTSAQAEAIILKHCQGMSVAEISRHLNRTPDAVGGLLKHGMRKLRELMPREG
jgi:RNA polymerase sigma-70 factor, ECF subfamily